MKDLKHLIFFEDLLQQANNQLVQQAVDQGQIALGYNCYYIPEVLLNLPGCFSSRLRAPRSASPDIASYYMTGRNCPYVRCILERAIEGGYNYLGALFGAECCAAMERMEEHFQLLHPVKNDRFFLTIIDPPMKGDQTSLDYYKAQLQLKVLDALREHYGVDVSDDAIRAAVEGVPVSTYIRFGFAGQPIAHTEWLWNLLGMTVVGWGCTLLGGCPLRQLILAGEGNGDSAVTVLGMMAGAAISHNFGLAGNADALNEAGELVVGGISTAGKVAVILGFAVCLAVSLMNLPGKEEKA